MRDNWADMVESSELQEKHGDKWQFRRKQTPYEWKILNAQSMTGDVTVSVKRKGRVAFQDLPGEHGEAARPIIRKRSPQQSTSAVLSMTSEMYLSPQQSTSAVLPMTSGVHLPPHQSISPLLEAKRQDKRTELNVWHAVLPARPSPD